MIWIFIGFVVLAIGAAVPGLVRKWQADQALQKLARVAALPRATPGPGSLPETPAGAVSMPVPGDAGIGAVGTPVVPGGAVAAMGPPGGSGSATAEGFAQSRAVNSPPALGGASPVSTFPANSTAPLTQQKEGGAPAIGVTAGNTGVDPAAVGVQGATAAAAGAGAPAVPQDRTAPLPERGGARDQGAQEAPPTERVVERATSPASKPAARQQGSPAGKATGEGAGKSAGKQERSRAAKRQEQGAARDGATFRRCPPLGKEGAVICRWHICNGGAGKEPACRPYLERRP